MKPIIRKINFSDIILFVLGLLNTSFDFERINAVLSKARDKVQIQQNIFDLPCSVAGKVAGISRF